MTDVRTEAPSTFLHIEVEEWTSIPLQEYQRLSDEVVGGLLALWRGAGLQRAYGSAVVLRVHYGSPWWIDIAGQAAAVLALAKMLTVVLKDLAEAEKNHAEAQKFRAEAREVGKTRTGDERPSSLTEEKAGSIVEQVVRRLQRSPSSPAERDVLRKGAMTLVRLARRNPRVKVEDDGNKVRLD